MRSPRALNMVFMSLRLCFLEALFLRSIASVSCLPILIIGFRLDSGSWKTIAILSPRTLWNSSSGVFIRSLSPYSILPPSLMALPARIPMMARLVTDLPEPDSPTIARVSPEYRSKLTSRTACTLPLVVLNEIVKSFTSSFFSAIIRQLLSVKD